MVAAWGEGRRAYGACHGDLCALPCRMLEAASLWPTGAAGWILVPRQVFQHCPACVVLVCTQGAFRWFHGPSRRGERHRLPDGAICRWFEGQVGQCGANAWPGAAASRARVAGAGPRLRTASRCTSACSHACQCVEPIWRSGLPLNPGRGRLVGSGTLWSGPPAGALGRRGAPLPATPPAPPPGHCPSAGPGAGGRGVRPPVAP